MIRVYFEISTNVKIERHNPSIKGAHVSKCETIISVNVYKFKIWLERGQSEKVFFFKIAGVLKMKMAKFKTTT